MFIRQVKYLRLLYATVAVLLITPCSVQSSFAANCDEIDLNKSKPLKEMPIQDQDGSGTCYAFVAAQLLEFEQRARGGDMRISAIDLALNSSKREGRDTIEGGLVKDVISTAVSRGITSKACVDKEIRAFVKDTSQTSEQFVSLLETVYSSRSFFLPQSMEVTDASMALRKNGYTARCAIQPTLEKILQKDLWDAGVTETIKKIIYSCEKQRVQIPKYNYSKLDSGSDKNIRSFLDQSLSKGKPVDTTLCAEILDGTKPHSGLKGNLQPQNRNKTSNLKKCSPHAVLTVGRKELDGKCHYLIRNSWGAQWSGKGHTCACKTSKNYYENCNDLKKVEKLARSKYESLKLKSDASEVKMQNAGKLYEKGGMSYEQYMTIYNAYAKANGQANQSIDQLTKLDLKNRVYVGCWVEGDNLIANTLGVGKIQ